MSTLTPTLAHTFCRALGKFKVSAAVPHHSAVPWLTGSNRKQRCPRCPITRVFVGSEDVTPYNWSLLKSSGVSNPRGQQGSGPSSGSRVVLLLASCKHRGGRVWPIQTKAWIPPGNHYLLPHSNANTSSRPPLRLCPGPALPLAYERYQKGEVMF